MNRCIKNKFYKQYQSRNWLRQINFLNLHQWFLGNRQLLSWSLFPRNTKRAVLRWCWNRHLRWQPNHLISSFSNALRRALYVIIFLFCLCHCISYQILLCFWSSLLSLRLFTCIFLCRFLLVHSKTRITVHSDAFFLCSHTVLRWHYVHLQLDLQRAHSLSEVDQRSSGSINLFQMRHSWLRSWRYLGIS